MTLALLQVTPACALSIFEKIVSTKVKFLSHVVRYSDGGFLYVLKTEPVCGSVTPGMHA